MRVAWAHRSVENSHTLPSAVWPPAETGAQIEAEAAPRGARAGRTGTLAAMLPVAALSLLGACSDVIPPDAYQGTVDPTSFDQTFRLTPNGTLNACMVPRAGLGGATGIERTTWLYLGPLVPAQLDLTNASDPAKSMPASVYQVKGCDAPEGRAEKRDFDPRLDNYSRDVQYPVLATGFVPAQAGTAVEPTAVGTYKPWHMVVPVEVQADMKAKTGCNDIKSERSLLERAGWNRETKVFPDGGPTGYAFKYPPVDQIRAGTITFKDWPMVNVAMPILNGTDGQNLCPFVTGSKSVYPKFPGDVSGSFQFPSQSWLRGLLGGYLDGGDVPVTTDPTKCPALVATGQSCRMTADCMGMAKGEVCTSSRCLAPLPVCPVVNDLYVAKGEVLLPTETGWSAQNPLPNATVTLKDAVDPMLTRTADILTTFTATPGQPGFSPVCRLRYYDPTKLTCTRKEAEAVAPRTVCTAAEIVASPGALITVNREVYVHCLFLQKTAS